jgi:uncharacterized protein
VTKNEILNALKQYKNENQTKYQIVKIGIFGSIARDQINEESDIDIVVVLKKQDLFYIIGIKQELEQKLIHPVDIVSYRKTMNKFLKQRIDTEAVYV